MTGEMLREDLTREEYPLHFAVADALKGSVEPFDVYQGPYVLIGEDVRVGRPPYQIAPRGFGVVRLWLLSEDGFAHRWYNEANEKQSGEFLMYESDEMNARQAVEAAREVL